jgi:predicted nucleotidyltransferase
MARLEEALRQEIIEILRDAGAVFAFIHGSAARGTARAESDIDVAAWWDSEAPPSFEVLLPARVDLLVLNGAPLELAGRVAVDGVLLFDEDPAVRVRWVAQTRKIYFDERPRIERSHRSLPRVSAVVDETRVLRLVFQVDDRIVLAMLDDPSDLDQFSRQVAEAWR